MTVYFGVVGRYVRQRKLVKCFEIVEQRLQIIKTAMIRYKLRKTMIIENLLWSWNICGVKMINTYQYTTQPLPKADQV